MDLVKQTVFVSLLAQIITTIIGSIALLKELRYEDQVLDEILGLEVLVQIIEAIFYIWFAFFFHKNMTRNDIAKYRYYDWVFTTPMMLLSTAVFFAYQAGKQTGTPMYSIRGFFQKYGQDFGIMAVYNFLMLLFGYLHEIGIMSLLTSNTIGFAFFGLAFYKLYEFARLTPENMPVFWVMFVLWGLYGVAAMYKNLVKNTAYNILDIFSKNFYGVYLAWVIWNKPSV